MAEEKDIDSDIVRRANMVFRYLSPSPDIIDVTDIEVVHFVRLYETMMEEDIPGSKEMTSVRSKSIIAQFLIDTLGRDLFGISLDHITGFGIATHDRRCIYDLLEIFAEMINFMNRSGLKDVTLEEQSSLHSDDENEALIDLPPKIRDVLDTLRSQAEATLAISNVLKQSERTVHPNRSEFTQTTPVSMTTSGASPITWASVLSSVCRENPRSKGGAKIDDKTRNTSKKVDRNGKRSQTLLKPVDNRSPSALSVSHPRNQLRRKQESDKAASLGNVFISQAEPKVTQNKRINSTKPIERPNHTKPIERPNPTKPTQRTITTKPNKPKVAVNRPKSVIKPKAVLGTKLRKFSIGKGTSKTKGKRIPDESLLSDHVASLIRDAKEIKEKLLETRRQIGQLKKEETFLQNIYSIMTKEIHYFHTQVTPDPVSVGTI